VAGPPLEVHGVATVPIQPQVSVELGLDVVKAIAAAPVWQLLDRY